MSADQPSSACAQGVPAPSVADVREALERICSSDDFSGSGRLVAFLRYLVDQDLAGHGDRLKAYSVAVSVFGRGADFDPQTDPIVRIEASRLRRTLERYYLTSGKDDPVVIAVPKGAYVPVYQARPKPPDVIPPERADGATPASQTEAGAPFATMRRQNRIAVAAFALSLVALAGLALVGLRRSDIQNPAPPALPPYGPTLAVMPFEAASRDADAQVVATGISNELIDQIARFSELRVLGRETSRQAARTDDPAGYLKQYHVRYLVEGVVRRHDGSFSVTARLVDAPSGTVLWSRAYDDRDGAAQIVETQADIAGRVATTLAKPYGVLFQASAGDRLSNRPDDWDAYRCAIAFYDFRAALTEPSHAAARDCLEKAVQRFPSYATAWAMLSLAYLEEDRAGFNRVRRKSPALDLALQAAEKAVQLEPENVRALEALMTVQFFRQDVAKGMEAGEAALRLNPRDSELLGEFGSRVAQAGQWERGRELLRAAVDQNPGNASYYRGHLALAEMMLGRPGEAVAQIRQSDLQRYPLYNLVAAVVFANAGELQEAKAAAARFSLARPDFAPRIDEELAKRNFRPQDSMKVKAAMVRSGLLKAEPAGL